jgi:hypothetical protein
VPPAPWVGVGLFKKDAQTMHKLNKIMIFWHRSEGELASSGKLVREKFQPILPVIPLSPS